MPEKKIRWAVLSTANIGRATVIPAIQASHNGELVAVASRDPGKASEFVSRLGIPRSYGSYAALLEAEDVDAVYIPLPNSLHREWTIRAAQAGKHILCEKPLALNADECLEMDAAARQHGVLLMEAFMYRFHPRTQKVLELVQAGAIGELRLIHSAFTFRLTRPDNIRWSAELGGGSLMDVGCYCVNLSRTVAGALGDKSISGYNTAEPEVVQAVARWSPSGVDEQMAGTLHFTDGLLAQFDSALTMERREAYELAGTEGFLAVEKAFLPGEDPVTIAEVHGRQEKKYHTVDGTDEYQLMVEHFADCILQDKTPAYTAVEAAANMRVIKALYRSAENGGRPETVQS